MFSARSSRIVFKALDLLGTLAVALGVVFAVYGFFSGFTAGAIYSLAIAGSGLSTLAVAHIGGGIVSLCETNREILDHLKR